MNTKKTKSIKDKTPKTNNSQQGIKSLYFYIGIFLLSFLVYGNTLKNSYALDDDIITRNNAFVREGTSGISKIFSYGFLYGFNGRNDQSYRPIPLSSIALEYQLWGDNPEDLVSKHHLMNIIYYALCGIILFLFLQLLFKEYDPTISFFITLLYLVHPIHTEVVANIKSRDEILGFLFIISALYFMLKYYDGDNRKHIILGCICFLAALLCKESVLPLLLILPLMVWFFRTFERKKALLVTGSWLGVFAIYMLLRSSILDNITFDEQLSVINNSLMSAGSLSQQLATEIYVLGKYLQLLFVPYPLSYDYSFAHIPIMHWTSLGTILSVLAYILLAIVSVIGIRKKEPFAFGILFYLVALVLVSNVFIKIGSSMGERFMFTPSLGFIIALVLLSLKLLKISPNVSVLKFPKAYLATAGAIIFVFGIMARNRNADWENNLTLFSADVVKVPNSSRAHSALGFELTERAKIQQEETLKKQDFEAAIAEFKEALRILPTNPESLYNLGYTYSLLGDQKQSLDYYKKTIAADKKYAKAFNNIGVYYFQNKVMDTAIYYFESAAKADPKFMDALANLGISYQIKGDVSTAEKYYNRALEINPNNEAVIKNLETIKKSKPLGK